MKRFLVTVLFSLSPLLVSAQVETIGPNVTGDEDIANRPAESYAAALKESPRFTFFFAGGRNEELTPHPTPVQRHAGPQLGEVYTNVFIWSHEGRPEAIASISNWYLPRRYLGLAVTSLAQENLIGMRDGQEIWRPEKAGVELKPIPDAGVPGTSPTQRLREMRSLARDFSADFKRTARYPEAGKLRLLSQPLYRYESTNPNLFDGALFGFADGTSSQLVLLIEARKHVTVTRWEYAIAPRNSMEFHMWYKGRPVWNLPQLAPPWENSKDPTNTYTVFPDLQEEGSTQGFVKRLLASSGNQRVDTKTDRDDQ